MRATKSPVVQPPPAWASDLADRASAFLGAQRRPVVVWHRSNEPVPATLDSPRKITLPIAGVRYPTEAISAGWTRKDVPVVAQQGTIELWAGTARRDQRLVLLHEIAHWFLAKHHHSPTFWAVAWSLYVEFMPRSLDYVLGREAMYRTGALRAAVKAGIVDANTAMDNPHLRKAVPLKEDT